MADVREQRDEKSAKRWVPEEDALHLCCCSCKLPVREPAWLLACLHACCDRCLDTDLANVTATEAGGSDGSRSFGDSVPASSTPINKAGGSLVCQRCKELSRVVTPVSGELLSAFSKEREAAASRDADQNSCLSGESAQPRPPPPPSLSSVTKIQGSQLFCLDCNAPCREDEDGGEIEQCLAREHDVCPTRHPRVAKRLSQLQSDAQQVGAMLARERTDLVAAQDDVARLDRKLSEIQEQHLDTLLENKRILIGAVDKAYERAADELRQFFGSIKVKAAEAMSDASRILARADYALYFSETLGSAALASPNVVAAHPELLKCVQQQLLPITTECHRAKLGLAAAATFDPEQDIDLIWSKPNDLVQHLTSFIGKPTLRAVEKKNKTPEVYQNTDVYQTQEVVSLSDKSSISSNEGNKRLTTVITDLTNVGSLQPLPLAESSGSSAIVESHSKDATAFFDSEHVNGSAVFRNARQDPSFDQASVADSHVTWSAVVSGHGSRFGGATNDRQLLPLRVSSQEPLAAFECLGKCWDIAIAEDSDAMFIAAYEDGLRELDFNGEEISSWRPMSASPWRSHEARASSSAASDGVYTVDALRDGRVVVGLLRSSAVAVLRRVALQQLPPGEHDGDQCVRGGSGWVEDGERVQLGARPWRLSTNGGDLVAVIQSSYGAKTLPSATFVVASLSRRTVVGNHRLPFAIASVAVVEQRLFAASYGEVDDRQYQRCTVVELNQNDEVLWQMSYEDSLFDLACHPSGTVVYLALKYRRNMVAVGGGDGRELAAGVLPRHACGPVRLSLRRGSNGRQKPTVMILLRYDLRSIEVHSVV